MYKGILLFIFVNFFCVSQGIAQRGLGGTPSIQSISNPGTGKFYYANRNDPPRAIEFEERAVTSSQFLNNINRYLNVPVDFTFTQTESNTDQLGMQHRLLQQYYKGTPIEGMVYRVHERGGFVRSANGKTVRDIKLDTNTKFSEEQAFQYATKYLNTKDTTVRPGKKLIASKDFAFTPESFVIVFQFDIDVSFIEQWRISIDARNGDVVNKVSLVNSCVKDPVRPLVFGTGTGLTNYYGRQNIKVDKFEGGSRLEGETAHGGRIGTYDFRNVSVLSLFLFFEWHSVSEFYSFDDTYDNAHQKAAVSAQWGTEQAYEYYYTKHNRNSFDNNGTKIKSYVRVDSKMDGAFWTHNLLAFGEGSNNNPLVELDVVSHELTHGVTQFEAGLEYYQESGALNESFSDIFGKAVEFDTFGDTAPWQLARHFQHGCLRDMSNPNLKNQPDTYLGNLWYTGVEDGGGVHTNSGVQNYWFYLLCEGGSGVNDQRMGYSVEPIGMDVASKIAYRNLTEYLSYFSDYMDSRIGSMLATADLYGKSSAAYREVEKAWDAVGVIEEPIITGLQLYDITATTVKLKGSLLPRAETATYHFEYGTTPAHGSSSTIYQYADKVEGKLTGLQSRTKYYVRLVATNEHGSTFVDSEFTTISLAPVVKIRQTVDVAETTATLHGDVNPNSLATSFYFEYGLTPALGLVTLSYPMPDTTEFIEVSAPVMDLQPRKTYFYRLVAVNDFASAQTTSVSFFTATKPVLISFAPTTGPIGTEVTIKGQNFNQTPGKNLVNIGATRATVLSSTSTEMKVRVPVGASLAHITMVDAESGLAAESVQEFIPTFTGGFAKNDLQLRIGNNDYIYQALVQDMDGDNKPDIVALHYLGFSVFQNVNQGGDLTNESFYRTTFNAESTPGYLSLIDFDGDGLKDVVTRYRGLIRIYPNRSVPGFAFFGLPVDFAGSNNLGDIIFRDFDMDGHIDIAGIRGTEFIILRNENPPGILSADNFTQRYVKVIPYYINFLNAVDLNADGKPDILTGPYSTNIWSALRNNSSPGSFDFDEVVIGGVTRDRSSYHYSQDLNQDNKKDIISLSYGQEGKLGISENTSTMSDITLAASFIALSGTQTTGIQSGDINGDGKTDLLVATAKSTFFILQNKNAKDEPLSETSFETLGEFGMGQPVNTGHVETITAVNDLNGDGRPEVINANSYYYGPHDGYHLEIWQNTPNPCVDPSLVKLEVYQNTATIILPPNRTMDEFDIAYTHTSNAYWNRAYSTTIYYLSPGESYQLRVRAKCHLDYTQYHYTDFVTECTDLRSLSIINIGVTTARADAYNLSSLEIQYSPTGEDLFETLPLYVNEISGLKPGTTYDIRFRGRCPKPGEFHFKQFTTLCPNLTDIQITNIAYNKAEVTWTSNYLGEILVAYSTDQVNWTSADALQMMYPLLPAQKYFVRAAFKCRNGESGFVYKSFRTPCPAISSLNADNVTPFSANINWTDPSATGSYIFTYSMIGSPVKKITTSSTSFGLENLDPGTEYSVTVAPECSGTKEFSTIAFSTTCFVPFDLQVNDASHTTAELSWSDNYGGVTYFVDYSVLGSKRWVTATTDLTQISLSELRPGVEYEARVHINCLSETAPFVSVRFETSLYEKTSFFPNPTGREITIQPSKDLINNRFFILDNVGRVVSEGELREYTIDLSSYPAGVYTLKIEGEPPMRIVKH